MIGMNMTREEAMQMISLLIDRSQAILAELDVLNEDYCKTMSMLAELEKTLTGAETEAPADVAEIDWQVGEDRDRLNRLNRAIKEPSEVNQLSDELFQVVNGKGKIWVVKIEGSKGSCTCPDFQKRGRSRGMPCKHMYAAKMDVEKFIAAEKHADPECQAEPGEVHE